MTTAINGSAFPPAVADLLPRAQAWVTELGHIPSQNRLKAEFKVGTDKARELRNALLHHDPPTVTAAVAPKPPTVDDAASTPDVPPAAAPTPAVAPPATVTAAVAIPVAVPTAPAAPAARPRKVATWPVLLLALPAFVAIWSGWVGLGGLTGFGVVHPLPGIFDRFSLNTAITLPIGVETYAAYALRVWLSPRVPRPARRFARWSAIGSLLLGAAGQVAYHLMASAHVDHAPVVITTAVASLPVAVLGMGAALAHLLHADTDH